MRRRTVLLLATLFAAHAAAQAPNDEAAADGTVLDAAAAEAKGFDYWLGRGVERDFAQAVPRLEQAAAAGHPYAAAALADLYWRGNGVARDLVRARKLATQSAAVGVAASQILLGFQLLAGQEGSATRDPVAALPWLQAAAEQEDATALFYLAMMYRNGDGVAANMDLSRQLLTRAAELGYPPAGAQAGMILLTSDAVAEDVQRGVYFLRTAAASGDGLAAHALGMSYLRGRHFERDAGLAAQWLTRASELKVPLATIWLAELHAKGVGVTADPSRAAELRQQALATMSVADRNVFAWGLAVGSDPDLRNGAFAVEVMETVIVEAPRPAYLDTLAAAYAEAGRFDDAVRAQQRAIDALPSAMSAAQRSPYAERAALYAAGQAYREEP